MKELKEILLILCRKINGFGAVMIFLWLITWVSGYFILKEYWRSQAELARQFKAEKKNIYDVFHEHHKKISEIDTLLTKDRE